MLNEVPECVVCENKESTLDYVECEECRGQTCEFCMSRKYPNLCVDCADLADLDLFGEPIQIEETED